MTETLLYAGGVFILGFYLLLHLTYLATLVVSLAGIWRQPRKASLALPELMLASPATPPATLLAPAYNEAASVVESVRALLSLRYPRLEVIVINDGSTDETLEELVRAFSMHPADLVYRAAIPTRAVRRIYVSDLYPGLMVVDKANGGKADALNAGLNLCRTPWVCSVDADSVLEEDALLRIMRPAMEDSTVVACSGIVRIVNGCRVADGRVLRVALPRNALANFQTVEYLHGFLQGRLGWSWINALLIISGAFGVFRADVLRTIGGYSTETVAEDMEIVVRLHRYFRSRREPYRVVFVPDPVCWTEAPSDARTLRRQRRRWQRGLAQVMAMHRGLFFRPRTGLVGWLAMPVFALELVTPLVEIAGYLVLPLAFATGAIGWNTLLFYFLVAFLLATFYACFAVLLEEFTYRRYASPRDLLRLFLYAVGKQAGYHQMVTWWRLEGTWEFLRGRKQWGEQQRAGFGRTAARRPA